MTTDNTPNLTVDELDLLDTIDAWSAMYLNPSDFRTAHAESLEAKGLITIDRLQAAPLLTLALVHPSAPSPVPTLTVLPKRTAPEGSNPKAWIVDQLMGYARSIAVFERSGEHIGIPTQLLVNYVFEIVDPLQTENESLKAQIATLKRRLAQAEDFGDFMEEKGNY